MLREGGILVGGIGSLGAVREGAASPAAGKGGGELSSVGGYRLLRRLGEGGMGRVYLARHPHLGRRVALKVLRPELAAHPARVAQLRAEAGALGEIEHENVVKVIGFGEASPHCFLVMEYLEGRPLTGLMGRPVDPEVAIPLLLQVCAGLEALHRHHVLHRDLKPDNIFLVARPGQPAPRVKLLDFGLATRFAEGGVVPGDGAVGTARYMAPEQWESRPLDARTDLYALGVCAFGLATGRPPFADRSEEELQQAHCYRPAPDARSVHPGVPEVWARVIARALAKNPAERFQTVAELARAFEDVLAPLPILVGTLALPEAPRASGEAPARGTQGRPGGVGPLVQGLLERYRRIPDEDVYALLGAPPEADTGELWKRAVQRLGELSELAGGELSLVERRELRALRRRVVRALCAVGLPHRRLARDAARGNLAGVARCITAMGAKAVLALRSAQPPAPARDRLARRYRRLGHAWARRGQWGRALEAWRQALEHDPLDVSLHRRYWALKREVLGERLSSGRPA